MSFRSGGRPKSSYRNKEYKGSLEDQEELLKVSRTLYIGNLSFYTTEEQIYELFSKVGRVRRIIMGLNKHTRQPCGFCFVEYVKRESAENAVKYVSMSKLDDRIIRCDWDAGFEEGRQYGRGKSGGQVRDEFRDNFDQGRGGYGRKALWEQGMLTEGGGETQTQQNLSAPNMNFDGASVMAKAEKEEGEIESGEPSNKRSRSGD